MIFKNAVSLCFVFRKQALCTLAAFSVWYWEIKDSLSLRKAIFLTMKHAKPKTSPSMYCLGCLQNQKHSTEIPAWPEPLRGRRWIKRKEDGLLPWGKNSRIFFVVVIYVVGKWIDSERDGLWNTTGVVLCVYMCAYTTTERLRCVVTVTALSAAGSYKIALKDEEGPGSGKQVWGTQTTSLQEVLLL